MRVRRRERGNYNDLQRFENSTESMSINEIDSQSPECLSLQLNEFPMGHYNEDDVKWVDQRRRGYKGKVENCFEQKKIFNSELISTLTENWGKII